jgi:uncharacterized protein YceK
MEMKKILLLVCLAGFVGTTSGCSTIAVRCTPSEARRGMPVYCATLIDAGTIFTGGGFYAYGDCNNGLGKIFGFCVAVPLSIVDLPISLVSDTLFLQCDLYRINHEEPDEKATNQIEQRLSDKELRTVRDRENASWKETYYEQERQKLKNESNKSSEAPPTTGAPQ